MLEMEPCHCYGWNPRLLLGKSPDISDVEAKEKIDLGERFFKQYKFVIQVCHSWKDLKDLAYIAC